MIFYQKDGKNVKVIGTFFFLGKVFGFGLEMLEKKVESVV